MLPRETTIKHMILPIQHFADNPLDISIGNRKDETFLLDILSNPTTLGIIVKTEGRAGKMVLCEDDNQQSRLFRCNVQHVLQLTGQSSLQHLIEHYVVILLGFDHDTSTWFVCIDLGKLSVDMIHLNPSCLFQTGRSALTDLPRGDLAIAGRALAVSSWHDANSFCGKTGFPTVPIECGMKRYVPPSGETHSFSPSPRRIPKIYPRIDPVVIAAIISPDKQYILLGSMKAYSSHFFSCLSGFVEPCESIEHAICREVWEEAGVRVDEKSVSVVGSQPWPIGRGGGCEIMIGCVAVATTTDLVIQDSEVREVRWFSKDEVRSMLVEAVKRHGTSTDGAKPIIPGPYAIAYHLVKHFVDDFDSGEARSDSNGRPRGIVSTCRTVSAYWLLPLLFYAWALSKSP